MLTKLWRTVVRRSGLRRLVGRPWAPAAAAAFVLLASVLALASVVASCSSLGGRARIDRLWGVQDQEPDIRVRIRKGPGTMTFDGPGPFLVRTPGSQSAREMAGPLAVTCGPEGLLIGGAPAGWQRPGVGVGVVIAPGVGKGGTGRLLRCDGTDYPGTLQLDPRSEDGPEAFDGIAVMPIELYLPGVVAHEMLARWPSGAYRVQAVCARTYALHDRARARKAGRRFDVESTTADQVYGGVSTNPAVVGAVQSTRGMVVTWDGGLLRTYYSSTCGGRPGSAAEVWPTRPGYEFNLAAPLQGGARGTFCDKSSGYSWETVRDIDEVGRRVRAWGRYAGHPVKSLGKVRSVSVAGVNSNDRPVKYQVVDDRGQTFRVTAEEFRVACNWPAEGLPAVTRVGRVNSSDFQVEIRAGRARFIGRGLGHGIGMCQWCAKGMAERGEDWRAMLGEFYPGASVERLY